MWASSTNLSQQWLNEHGISCTSCEVVKNLSNATAPRKIALFSPLFFLFKPTSQKRLLLPSEDRQGSRAFGVETASQ
jgi:hypothetical protein